MFVLAPFNQIQSFFSVQQSELCLLSTYFPTTDVLSACLPTAWPFVSEGLTKSGTFWADSSTSVSMNAGLFLRRHQVQKDPSVKRRTAVCYFFEICLSSWRTWTLLLYLLSMSEAKIKKTLDLRVFLKYNILIFFSFFSWQRPLFVK